MKITQLAQVATINDEDVFPCVQGDETKKVTAKMLRNVEQTYNKVSKNAQSGVAVAEAFSEKFNTVGTGKNLFNPDDEDIVVGKLFNDNGELSVTNTSYLTSGYTVACKSGNNI